MKRIYFISDVHLGAEAGVDESEKIENLISFFKAIKRRTDILYIVGDLFDFWFEYRSAIPKVNIKVLAHLLQLIEQGVRVRYFAGNHDIWLGNYLRQEIGAEILFEPLKVEHNGLRLFIAHGDGLAKGDRRLRLLNKIFKNKVNIFLFKLIHPDFGIPLARKVSNTSKDRGPNPYDEDYRRFALSKLQQGFDAVILGHTHKPLFEKISSKYYINLGDWIDNFTYLELSGRQLQLKRWSMKEVRGLQS
ncbi:MAG: UDP-2,3-diacylglucosamine diphosphatase [bacterium]